MLRKALVNDIRNHLRGLGFDWGDFKVSEASGTWKLEYVPLPTDCYLYLRIRPLHSDLQLTTAPGKNGLRASMVNLAGQSEYEITAAALQWANMLRSEVEAHQELGSISAHQDEVDELLAQMEEEHGPLPEEPHQGSEIQDVLTTLEELRKRLDTEIRARKDGEEKAEELLGEMNRRMDKLEKAVGYYSKRHVVTTVLSILVWFGKNAEDLKKLGQFVTGLLQ